jgi:hypothetical protein
MKPRALRPFKGVLLLAIAIMVHIVFCLSLHYHFLNPLFYVSTHSKGQGGCFFGFYQAGVNLLNGESIYGCRNYATPAELAVPFYHHYRYLPFCSYITSVVSKLVRPWPAYWIWVAVNEVLLASCILITLRLRRRYGSAAVIASALWLLYSPLYIELYMGQVCFTMTFLIFLILYPYLKGTTYGTAPHVAPAQTNGERFGGASVDGTEGTAEGAAPAHVAEVTGASGGGAEGASAAGGATAGGAKAGDASGGGARGAAPLGPAGRNDWLLRLSWILTLLLKSFTALYLLTFIRIGKKKLVAAGMLATLLTSVPYFLSRPQDLGWFLHLNLQPLPAQSMGGYFGFSVLVKDIIDRSLNFPNGNKISLGAMDISTKNLPLLAILAAILLLSFLLTIRKKRIDPLGSITLWTLTFFLVFKDIWEYHYVILVPLFVGLYLETGSKYLLVLFAMLAIPTPFVLYDVPASDNPQAYWSAPLSIIHHSMKAVPTLLFYLWIVRRELRDAGGFRSILSLGKPAPAET